MGVSENMTHDLDILEGRRALSDCGGRDVGAAEGGGELGSEGSGERLALAAC